MDPKRRRPEVRPGTEALETRELLTAGAGNTFSLTSGEITKPGGTTAETFKIDSDHFNAPTRGKLVLGIDIVPDTGSKVAAKVKDVKGPGGAPVPLKHIGSGPASLATIDSIPAAGTSMTYTVNIQATKKTSGKLLIGFYLPGDANGDGGVDAADVKAVTAAMGSKSTDPTATSKYNFDADANRDGRIDRADLKLTQQQLGAKTTVMPVVTANLSPGNGGQTDRVSTIPTASFAGVASPGSSLTYAEIDSKSAPVTATADAKGNYSLVVPLAVGSNTFKVTAVDPFGQQISGQLAAVTYKPTK